MMESQGARLPGGARFLGAALPTTPRFALPDMLMASSSARVQCDARRSESP